MEITWSRPPPARRAIHPRSVAGSIFCGGTSPRNPRVDRPVVRTSGGTGACCVCRPRFFLFLLLGWHLSSKTKLRRAETEKSGREGVSE